MSKIIFPSFPKGFVLAEKEIEPPHTFIAGPILPNFYIHPATKVESIGNERSFVIVLGECVPTMEEQEGVAASKLLSALQIGSDEFFRSLGDYAGRHAIIFGDSDNIRIVNDATSMRSVFYANSGGIVASHARLVEDVLGGEYCYDQIPFQYGFPGNRTPYSRTRILTPNTFYSMKRNRVHRFWPVGDLSPRTVDEAAEEVLERSVFALRAASNNRNVRLTLTAGLDSRAIFAIALHSKIKFETYTYGDDEVTDTDRSVAQDLAKKFGIKHTVVASRRQNPKLRERLIESNYVSHHGIWVEALMKYYESPDDLAVLGNALEIGRANSMLYRKNKAALPETAEGMANLHYKRMGASKRERAKKFGLEDFMGISSDFFQEFIDMTAYSSALPFLDSFDLFYWEYRMSAWQSLAMNERDFYGESFIPYNARKIYASMLGVPGSERYADAIIYRLIEMVDPAILAIPINPR